MSASFLFNHDLALGATISCGQNLPGSISVVGEQDNFSLLDISTGDTITIRMTTTSGGLGPALELYDGGGTLISSSSYPFAGTITLTTTLDSQGPYTLLAGDSGNNDTGDYSLFFQRVSDPCAPTTLTCGQALAASLAQVAQIDTYALDGVVQGDTITLRMTTTSGGLGPALELYDGSGTLISSPSYPFAGTITLTTTLDSPGPYTLLAGDSGNNDTGDYSLFFQRVSDSCAPTTLTCGQALAASLAQVAQIDTYALDSVVQGDTITIRMTTTSGGLGPALELYDGSGTLVSSSSYPFAGTITLTTTLDSPGPYTLLASDSGNNDTGDYSLFFQRVSDPCASTTLTCGQALAASLAQVAQIDTYALDGVVQGDTITIRMTTTSGGLGPALELYDGSGTLVSSSSYPFAGSITLTTTLDSPGPYTLLASDSGNNDTGDYSLFFQRLSDPCAPATLTCGQALAASLNQVAQIDTYALDGVVQGDTITIRMTTTSGGLGPALELYDGSGTLISSSSYPFAGTITLTTTLDSPGPYTLLAGDSGNNDTGGYSLFLQRLSNPCGASTLRLDQTIPGEISPVGELDSYVLQGVTQGESVTLCMPWVSGPLEPSLELYSAGGTQLGSAHASSGGTARLPATLNATGPYTVLAGDSGNNATGTYSISLRGATSSCATTDTSPPTVTLSAPSEGELVTAGAPYLIEWSSSDDVGVVSHTVRLSTDGGSSFPTVIASGLSGAAQSYLWQVPATLHSTKARIQVIAQDATGATGQAETAGDFVIFDNPRTRTIDYTYDSLNRLTGVQYSDGSSIQYRYDEVGNREMMTSTGPAVIHGDGFESGDTSDWAGSTGSVAVTTTAARTGSYGLRVDAGCVGSSDLVVPNGTTTSGVFEACGSVIAGAVRVDPGPVTFRAGDRVRLDSGFSVASGASFVAEIAPGLVPDAFVRDDSPAGESRYGARFSLRLDSLALTDGDQVELFSGFSVDGKARFRLILDHDGTIDQNRLILEVRQDDGSYASSAGNPVVVPGGWHTVEVDWRAATAGQADGRIDLALDGVPSAQLTNLANPDLPDRLRATGHHRTCR